MRIVTQFFAEPRDAQIDRAIDAVVLESVQLLVDIVAIEHLTGALREQPQQVEFGRRQFHAPPFQFHGAAAGVDHERTHLDAMVGGITFGGRDFSQVSPQASQQGPRTDRLGHVIIGAHFQADDFIHFLAAGGQDQDRPREIGPHFATDGKAVLTRQIDVQDHDVGRLLVNPLRRPITPLLDRHGETMRGQKVGHHVSQLVIVFDQQDSKFCVHTHTRIVIRIAAARGPPRRARTKRYQAQRSAARGKYIAAVAARRSAVRHYQVACRDLPCNARRQMLQRVTDELERSGMNPAGFNIASQDFKRNPFPALARLRAQGPFVQVRLPIIGRIWAATTYESVTTVLRDSQQFVLEPRHAGRRGLPGVFRWLPSTFRLLSRNMLTTDEPDHRRLRGLVEQAFKQRTVDDLRGRLVALVDQHLDHLEQQARASHGEVDLLAHFARPFPLAVICELLGLPDEDRPKFMRFARRLSHAASLPAIVLAIPGLLRLLRYLRQQFRRCREQPRPGLISALVAAEQEGQRLSEDELLAMSFLLLLAGHETTVHLITGGVLALLEHPDQLERLRGDWSLAPSAVDEVLRYVSPVQMTKLRYAAHDREVLGHSMRRGQVFTALLASANGDPAEFPEPETLDVGRQPNRHVGFGSGIHVCLGRKLAQAETSLAFERLWTRFPHLDLAQNPAELAWTGRLGIRALTQLPVRLHSNQTSRIQAKNRYAPAGIHSDTN